MTVLSCCKGYMWQFCLTSYTGVTVLSYCGDRCDSFVVFQAQAKQFCSAAGTGVTVLSFFRDR